jgi:hypothetical protein
MKETNKGVFRSFADLKHYKGPEWTCEVWEELLELKGVMWCSHHDKPLNYLTIDGSNWICGTGMERDPYEFWAEIHRRRIRMGTNPKPLKFWESS